MHESELVSRLFLYPVIGVKEAAATHGPLYQQGKHTHTHTGVGGALITHLSGIICGARLSEMPLPPRCSPLPLPALLSLK